MDTDKGKINYQECGNQVLTIQFDPSGRYFILPTMIGVKVIEWSTNKCKKVIGKGDASTLRFLGGVLILGKAKVDKQMMLARNATVANSSSSKSKEDDDIVSDSLFVTMAFNKRRFYIFSHLDTISKADESGDIEEQQRVAISRDILNEPPDQDDLIINQINGNDTKDSKLGKEAILRTTMGDIHIKLFPDETPKTVENFCGHARNGYYDNVIFHRVIKSFMIQTGDPLGDGTGGESIWGGEFEDEIVKGLRHDRPFTVSMANAGPNTNGSQFFITTVPTPWLDNKHTVFGRVTRGMDVCSTIENVKVDELDKPFEEISILSVDIL
jgi:peptidylprolyl isomerase domain and WD repeat-containing protein 1